MSQRILVVDDDKQIVRLVQSYLGQANYQVLTACDGSSALRIIWQERPDLIILDLMLPDHDGWEIIRKIRSDQQLAKLPVIMLTARVEDTDKIIGLELGADDYITKPFNPREVVARVRAVLRRTEGGNLQPHLIEIGDLRLDLDRHEGFQNGQPVTLTPTEYALLKTLMENPGHTFTRLQLIEKSLGDGYEALERTIDSHIKNVRKKLEPDPANPRYIHTIFGVGYRLEEPTGELP
ncbi:MAG: response regulator transcription factor [Chloroflexi bacterium AL-W]|nr:response regulator transcription factor [Chloroflexi bacterium AL-N1]NOK70714.1 response regulator transcription factor [Chloroflexi bacterium AL-N10]NOK78274.1 response regulator transcription factor [Chloroflexi bacterium AL-N5]NOK85617.1 response regulator transcription factor [Chloroflexi bacterium AL-W]NOK92531.1 response regulator transcription factor [Chloroflexi bacterium AL-N15]